MIAQPPPLPTSTSTTTEVIVEVQNLSKTFKQVHAVNDLTFQIRKGQVVGFIGANGAGKTTTMRMMATLETPDSGHVWINGLNTIHYPDKVRPMIGWMPDHFGVYPMMTVLEYLDFFARSYGLRYEKRKQRIEEVMEFADLTSLADRPMNKLSKGMGQRLCFGRMLLPDPEFLILDEPAAGLDPKARLEFKNLVRILSQRGKTLFISSHILSELSEMCDTMLFIDGGKLVYHGSAEELTQGAPKIPAETSSHTFLVDIDVLNSNQDLIHWIETNRGWKLISERKNGVRAQLETSNADEMADHLKKMIMDGLRVTSFKREERKLEDVFVDMIKMKF